MIVTPVTVLVTHPAGTDATDILASIIDEGSKSADDRIDDQLLADEPDTREALQQLIDSNFEVTSL